MLSDPQDPAAQHPHEQEQQAILSKIGQLVYTDGKGELHIQYLVEPETASPLLSQQRPLRGTPSSHLRACPLVNQQPRQTDSSFGAAGGSTGSKRAVAVKDPALTLAVKLAAFSIFVGRGNDGCFDQVNQLGSIGKEMVRSVCHLIIIK
jgi:hypothetical protein